MQASIARGIQHRFDEKTKLVTEFEWEHAVVSADDAGEVAVEQAYVEHQVSPTWGLRAGLFLVPPHFELLHPGAQWLQEGLLFRAL